MSKYRVTISTTGSVTYSTTTPDGLFASTDEALAHYAGLVESSERVFVPSADDGLTFMVVSRHVVGIEVMDAVEADKQAAMRTFSRHVALTRGVGGAQ